MISWNKNLNVWQHIKIGAYVMAYEADGLLHNDQEHEDCSIMTNITLSEKRRSYMEPRTMKYVCIWKEEILKWSVA